MHFDQDQTLDSSLRPQKHRCLLPRHQTDLVPSPSSMLSLGMLCVLTHMLIRGKFMLATARIIHDGETAVCKDCYDDGYHKGHPARGAYVCS